MSRRRTLLKNFSGLILPRKRFGASFSRYSDILSNVTHFSISLRHERNTESEENEDLTNLYRINKILSHYYEFGNRVIQSYFWILFVFICIMSPCYLLFLNIFFFPETINGY